jgi:hypothetical protein
MRHIPATSRRSPLSIGILASLACFVVATFAAGESQAKKPASRALSPTVAAADDDASGEEMPDEDQPVKKRVRKSAAKDKAKDKLAVSEDAANDSPAKIDHAGEGRVHDKQAGLSLVPPEGWQRATATQSERLRFFAPPQEARETGLVVSVSKDDGADLEGLAATLKQHPPRTLPGWKATAEGAVEIEGRSAYFVASSFRVQNLDLQQLQYFLRGDAGNFYTVTFTTDKGSFSKLRKVFQDCAKTVRCD